MTRLARRVPDLPVATRPSGIAGVYDVTDDWIPVYDSTSLAGYYVAIGTSGNQFKNAPVIGQLMTALITECEAGRDHDADPVIWRAPHTQLDVDLSHYSRLRAAARQQRQCHGLAGSWASRPSPRTSRIAGEPERPAAPAVPTRC